MGVLVFVCLCVCVCVCVRPWTRTLSHHMSYWTNMYRMSRNHNPVFLQEA